MDKDEVTDKDIQESFPHLSASERQELIRFLDIHVELFFACVKNKVWGSKGLDK